MTDDPKPNDAWPPPIKRPDQPINFVKWRRHVDANAAWALRLIVIGEVVFIPLPATFRLTLSDPGINWFSFAIDQVISGFLVGLTGFVIGLLNIRSNEGRRAIYIWLVLAGVNVLLTIAGVVALYHSIPANQSW